MSKPFKGTINVDIRDSVPDWDPFEPPKAPDGAPSVVYIVLDDVGFSAMSGYGGPIPTPNIDRIAAEGMTFFSFYAQPSCTPGRAAMQTGRIPNRSGMTTVAFQGQGGGLPAAEWTLASVLKTGGYKTFFTGKWHLGEADYALPNAQGYDEMKNCGLYHLNAYTYADPTWFPDMSPELRAMFARVTKGSLSGNAGQPAREDFKINGQYVDTPAQGVVGIPFFDGYVERAALEYLDRNANSAEPIFMSINFMKVHQPNMPHPEYIHKSMSKSKYADSVHELDARIGRIMDKIRSNPRLAGNTLVFYTTDNGAWQDVYPDAGYTPFRGTKGTVREGGNRVPAIAWMPGKIAANSKTHEMAGGPRRPADHLRQLRHLAGAVRPRPLAAHRVVLFHRERAVARRGARRQLQGGVQSARRQWRVHRRPRGRYQPRLEGYREIRRHGAAGVRPVAGPAGALRHLHEQLHRAHLDHGHHHRVDQEADEDVCAVSAAEAAERELHRPDDALGL
jgi:hypothetical protein